MSLERFVMGRERLRDIPAGNYIEVGVCKRICWRERELLGITARSCRSRCLAKVVLDREQREIVARNLEVIVWKRLK